MATVPTGKLERELRKLYVSWVRGLPQHEGDMEAYIESFRLRSTALIARLGGDVARLGVYLADFPAPTELTLSPYAGKIYDEMQLAAIRASVASGLNAKDAARAMLRAGLERSYSKLVRLARTETVSAYWKNQWDSTRGLDLVLLWSVEFGPRTCAWCKERDGMVVEYSHIRDHPNGRCTLAPTLPSQVRYKGSLDRDGNIYYDSTWAARASQASGMALAEV
ncbi:MuF-like minor capsid protein [Microbacterium phage Jenos]|nr:MuF-like minor capsid protein [Microbacterium phage Jenos]